MSKDKQVFYSVRTFINQQSPKLVLTDSDKGLVLVISANLMTKYIQMSCLCIPISYSVDNIKK